MCGGDNDGGGNGLGVIYKGARKKDGRPLGSSQSERRTGEALSRNAMIYPKRKPGDDISFLFLRLQAVRASGCAVALTAAARGDDDGMV